MLPWNSITILKFFSCLRILFDLDERAKQAQQLNNHSNLLVRYGFAAYRLFARETMPNENQTCSQNERNVKSKRKTFSLKPVHCNDGKHSAVNQSIYCNVNTIDKQCIGILYFCNVCMLNVKLTTSQSHSTRLHDILLILNLFASYLTASNISIIFKQLHNAIIVWFEYSY